MTVLVVSRRLRVIGLSLLHGIGRKACVKVENVPASCKQGASPSFASRWACGAVGSALPWHGRGREFESHQVHQIPQRLTGDEAPKVWLLESNWSPNLDASHRDRGHQLGHSTWFLASQLFQTPYLRAWLKANTALTILTILTIPAAARIETCRPLPDLNSRVKILENRRVFRQVRRVLSASQGGVFEYACARKHVACHLSQCEDRRKPGMTGIRPLAI